ncbi:hypothetical protein BASA81_015407 [Batrachochytrium salamandrivorans]|nr:hypothetical protein BASA81_015407 [Batrachochytrium salamandrivorans]
MNSMRSFRKMSGRELSKRDSSPVTLKQELSPSVGPELENALQIKSWTLAKKCIAQGFGTGVPGVLHLAIRQGAPKDVVLALAELYPHLVNEPLDGFEGRWTPLLLAVKSAPHLVDCLLRLDGVNVNAVLSVRSPSPSLARLLTRIHTQTGENAVLLACKEGRSLDVVQLLVRAGGQVNTQRNDGITALMVCTLQSQLELVEFLLASGADANLVNTTEGASALFLACHKTLDSETGETPLLAVVGASNGATSTENALAIIHLLIQAGADVDLANLSGETPLCVAAEKNANPELMQVLLQAGADVNKSSGSGMTPILFAIIRGSSSELARLLLENGAIVAAKFQSQTPLKIAQDRGYAHLVGLLGSEPPPLCPVRKPTSTSFAFCVQCRKTDQKALGACGCGLVAYCSPQCKAAHRHKHERQCHAATRH